MKKKTLQEHSKNYTSKTAPYEKLKKAEDVRGAVVTFLKKATKGKVILDVGCGDGFYAKKICDATKRYFALDSSKTQIEKLKLNCSNTTNVEFMLSSAEYIDLPDNHVDLAICTWSISVINGFRKKSNVLREIERIVKPSGEIIIIENDWRGEFETIRNHPIRTKRYNEWLMKKGFGIEKEVDTYFKFDSTDTAKKVFHQIWGSRVANKITDNKIEHKIIIFSKTNQNKP